MRAAEALARIQKRSFEMITAYGFSDEGIGLSELLDALELPAEHVGFGADEREENAACLVRAQSADGVPKIGDGEIGALKIDAGKTVDLQVEE